MVAPFAAFVALMPSLGLGQALIQAENLTRAQIESAFWVSTVLGVFCVVCLLIAAPFLGAFLEDPRASQLTMATAATLFVTNLSAVHTAVVGKEMRFGMLSLGDLISSISLFTVTLVAALTLRNYWALWLGLFASALITTVYYWTISSWRPAAKANFAASSSLWKISSAVTGANILNFFSRNVDSVLIGKLAGAYELGLYDRSYRLMTLPLSTLTEPLGRIMLPVLANLRREPDRYRLAFLKVAWIVMLCSAPIAIVVASASEATIVMLLGERWTNASGIFFWLSLGAIYQPLSSVTGWLFVSLGRSRDMMVWALISSSTTIASFAVGIFWGAEGVAQAYVLMSLARLPLLYFWTTRTTPVSQCDMYLILVPPTLVGATVTVISMAIETQPSLFDLSARTVIAYSVGVASAMAIPMGRAALVELFQQLPTMLASLRGRSG